MSICVILLILLLYLVRNYREKIRFFPGTIKQTDFPALHAVPISVQPPLRPVRSEDSEKHELLSKHLRAPEHLEENFDRTQYGVHRTIYQTRSTAALLRTYSTSSDDLDSSMKHEKHSPLEDNVEKRSASKQRHHPLTNSVSMNNLNTSFNSPQIQRIKTHHKRMPNRSSQRRDLTHHSKGHASSTSSSEGLVDPNPSNEKNRSLTVGIEMSSDDLKLQELLASVNCV